MFADFKASDAKALTLGADLAVAGSYRPQTRADEVRAAQLGRYTVTLDGKLVAGADAKLSLTVERDGQPVTDLQPYLGAYGHLVSLRSGDLAYLHVHPDGTPGDGTTQPGPIVAFHAAVPSPGTYQIFFDFKHRGVVRTAAFAASTSGTVSVSEPASKESADSEQGHHNH